ncbi:hypothetical protein H4R33_005836 [Dimargaris cristalligena]|uniref:Extracellular membrane protein CFEM domain-containing protein n=1 Tax=Dimargaris cristalligena TaxID=215637 RepID=A0A4P9ZUM0_9FUNG|nr:hypothetical protein H4R33_005836 [Dimargaris cristalligena]RKP37245.1 hypothetical protein BJ085DRAFT_40637 [Dimargaris cristalligena]|eukprot:RKP37245.1 hypothetical protein BJ085DRAFT_40637 [Dimargaris cristalligena]
MKSTFAATSVLLAMATLTNAALPADKIQCIEDAGCTTGPKLCYTKCFMTEAQYDETDACFNGCIGADGTPDGNCWTDCQAKATAIVGVKLSDIDGTIAQYYGDGAADTVESSTAAADSSATAASSTGASVTASDSETESATDSASSAKSTGATKTANSSAVSSVASSAKSTASSSKSTHAVTTPSSGDDDEDDSSSASTIGALTGSMTLAALAVAHFNL